MVMEEGKKMKKKNKKSLEPKTECCMCGDYGLSSEIVQCQTCHFRSQHSYCSNLYPKAESYGICNWCLVQELDQKTKHKTYNSKKNRRVDDHNTIKIKKKNKMKSDFDDDEQSIINHDIEIVGIQIGADLDHHPLQQSLPPDGSERVAVGGGGGGAKGRKPQVNVSSNKRGVRKMVRRYKFLDEVLASELQI